MEIIRDTVCTVQDEINNCQKCGMNIDMCRRPPKIYCGPDSVKVMIIGHSPATRTVRKAQTVLNMDIETGNLYRYITGEILLPLGVEKEQIYCTNLIKCFTESLPEDLEKTKKGTIQRMADQCVAILEKEIQTIQPKLIVCLSERVLGYLSLRYLHKRLHMKTQYGELFTIELSGTLYPCVPVPHIPKSGMVREHYAEQKQKLGKLKDILNR